MADINLHSLKEIERFTRPYVNTVWKEPGRCNYRLRFRESFQWLNCGSPNNMKHVH